MSDLIDRIKGLRYVHVPQASQLFEEAIAEIERLRLTDAEREAVLFFAHTASAYGAWDFAEWRRHKDALRGLASRCATAGRERRE